MSEKMIFCLGDGKYERTGDGYQKNLRIFNTDVTEEEYQKLKDSLDIKNIKLPIATWVDKKDMTDEEKENYSSYSETGGYLKTLLYQDAWKEMWGGFGKEDKDFFQSILHFDSKIFKEITGIDVKQEDDVEVTVEGKTTTISRKSAIALGLLK